MMPLVAHLKCRFDYRRFSGHSVLIKVPPPTADISDDTFDKPPRLGLQNFCKQPLYFYVVFRCYFLLKYDRLPFGFWPLILRSCSLYTMHSRHQPDMVFYTPAFQLR